jgi:hypothetical protein
MAMKKGITFHVCDQAFLWYPGLARPMKVMPDVWPIDDTGKFWGSVSLSTCDASYNNLQQAIVTRWGLSY